MLSATDITTFCDDLAPPGVNPYVAGQAPSSDVRIIPYDPAWPAAYEQVAGRVRTALGDNALELAHVGSTSVPGLAAKQVIDIDVTIADNHDESSYVPKLQEHGFTLVIREYWWYGHRLLTHREPRANVHIWSPDCPEAARHLIFRDWLRDHPEDRTRYLEAKQDAAAHINATGGHTNDYNSHKQTVIREIYGRAFTALGLL
jgi:GrpB-like predicted nucleotidyltransferase (UPF0157 family)